MSANLDSVQNTNRYLQTKTTLTLSILRDYTRLAQTHGQREHHTNDWTITQKVRQKRSSFLHDEFDSVVTIWHLIVSLVTE